MKTEKRNKGYTLIELIIVVAIFAVLLGILSPSLNAIPYFRMRRAAGSIQEAVKHTRTEAMNRLVGEMKLEWTEDGYYISYYLDWGKEGGTANVQQDQPTRIAPSGMSITYTDNTGRVHDLKTESGHALILTYDRSTGAFRPTQTGVISQEEILSRLEAGQDIVFPDSRPRRYCTRITVTVGRHSRSVVLNQKAGTCTMESN